MEKEQAKRIVEAMLFATDKPLPLQRMKEVLGDTETSTIQALVSELKGEYVSRGSSFHIIEVAGGIQLTTDSQYAPWINKLYKQDKPDKLSSPALETLAIIAYRQPVTRIDIEFIRGVNVDGLVKNLLEKGLIKVKGRKESVGHPFLYGTTREFLTCFGLNTLTDLPKLEDKDTVEEDVLKERE